MMQYVNTTFHYYSHVEVSTPLFKHNIKLKLSYEREKNDLDQTGSRDLGDKKGLFFFCFVFFLFLFFLSFIRDPLSHVHNILNLLHRTFFSETLL